MCRADPGSAIDELVGKKLERLRGRELTRRFARYDRPVFEFELGGGRARSEVQLVEVDPEDGRAKGGFEKIAPRARIGNRSPNRRRDVRPVRIGEASVTEMLRISEKTVATASR